MSRLPEETTAAVRAALLADPGRSNGRLAGECGVSDKTVARARRALHGLGLLASPRGPARVKRTPYAPDPLADPEFEARIAALAGRAARGEALFPERRRE